MARRATRYAKLRRSPFERKAVARGLDSQSKQARAMDVLPSEHNRALNGHQREISGFYVIRLLRVVGDANTVKLLDELFEVGNERGPIAS